MNGIIIYKPYITPFVCPSYSGFLENDVQGNPGLRNVHGILGSGIMTLFLVHFALGLQLGFSY